MLRSGRTGNTEIVDVHLCNDCKKLLYVLLFKFSAAPVYTLNCTTLRVPSCGLRASL
jgi:hypothetical protein